MKLNKLLIVIVIFALLFGGFLLYFKEGTLPVNKADTESKIFVIRPGEGLNSIVKNLSKEGLIRNTLVFYLVVKQKGIDKEIQAGDFRLSPSMDAYKLADTLTHGTLDVWVTIIEGLRKEEVAEKVSKELDIPEIEFIANAPEGYLFPDTYLIPKQSSAGGVVAILTNTFESRFTPEMRQKVAANGLTEHEAVVLASLVEREARLDEDRQEVASVILRRFKEGIPLQIDATVQYALGYQAAEKTWWKRDLTFEDLKINSPYNTYVNRGLPPEPICNPSLSSLTAVANADPDTKYLFYISDKTGKMHYGRNLEEHNRNVQRYLQ